MLTFPTSLRVYAHRFATDMRNYAGTVFMPSRAPGECDRWGSGVKVSVHNGTGLSR